MSYSKLKNHVIHRIKERFDIIITNEKYKELLDIAKNSHVIKELNNRFDIRELLYKEINMNCVFDKKINKIKTVLYPISKYKDVGIFSTKERYYMDVDGIVLSDKKYGYLVLLREYDIIGVIHTEHSINHLKLDIGQEIKVKVVSHFKDRKTNRIRTFLRFIN